MANLLFHSVLAVLYFSVLTGAKYEVCQKPACASLASDLQEAMNGNIKPCDNFYEHACGKWSNNYKAGPTTVRVLNYYLLGTKTIYVRLQEILETENPGEHSLLTKAKNFHNACMSTSEKKKDTVEAVKSYIKEAGGWPIAMSTGQSENTKLTWQAVHSKFSSVIGASPIFTLIVVTDESTGTKVPYIAPPTIGNEVPVPKSKDPEVFLAEPAVSNYLKVIKDIAEIVKGPGVTDAQLETVAREIFMFENNLRNIQSGSSVSSEIRKIEYLQKLYNDVTTKRPQKKVDWITFINEIFILPKSSLITLNKSDRILLRDESYFKSLSSILADTPERVIVNTIHWWFIKQTRSYANSQISEIMIKNINSSGMKKEKPTQHERWFECINVNPLKGAFGVAYIKKYFPDDARAKVKRMIKDIKSTMEDQIHKSKWIKDKSSKRAAEEKLTAMIELVGGPDWYTDPAKADAYYQGLSISDTHFINMLQGIKFIRQKELETLKKPGDRHRWAIDPLVINAANSVAANSLAVPVAILQPPFFHVDYPDAVNYAGIGAIIGHEMSHCFDQSGNQYDKDGIKRAWWSSDTVNKYRGQSKCFEDQFNGYWKGLGTRTLNENIADTTGVKMAFKAFKAHMKTPQYKDERLPGLDHLSPEELFFLSYASIRCEDIESNYVKDYMDLKMHAPHNLQVKGALSNSKDFANTFTCRKGSPMNPVKKCKIW